jgi:hypothetical protein
MNHQTKNGHIFICFETYKCLFTATDYSWLRAPGDRKSQRYSQEGKMTNPIDPKNLKPPQFNHGVSLEGVEISDSAATEELLLRVDRIFEEAEELWRWMYNE